MWGHAVGRIVAVEVARRAVAGAYRRVHVAPPATRFGGLRDAVLAGWHDPARAFRRSRRRAQRALAVRSFGTLGLAWLTTTVGVAPGIEMGEVFWGSATVAVGVTAVGAARRVWRLQHTDPPAPAPRRWPLPPRGSAVRPPLERLAQRERALAELLGHLGPDAAEARAVAADAAGALRAVGARAAAVEQARLGATPATEPGLDAALGLLLRQLEEGVAAYDSLVAAAADAVAASVTLHAGDPVLAARLSDAVDALAGLARGLREIAGPPSAPSQAS
jgi:hypothetical protein